MSSKLLPKTTKFSVAARHYISAAIDVEHINAVDAVR